MCEEAILVLRGEYVRWSPLFRRRPFRVGTAHIADPELICTTMRREELIAAAF